jgi:hypothetical protein
MVNEALSRQGCEVCVAYLSHEFGALKFYTSLNFNFV